MSKTKIKLTEVIIQSVTEKTYEGKSYYEYVCENGDTFNCVKFFEVGSSVSVYLSKYNNSLILNYSLKNE